MLIEYIHISTLSQCPFLKQILSSFVVFLQIKLEMGRKNWLDKNHLGTGYLTKFDIDKINNLYHVPRLLYYTIFLL